jgi:hypothetical protein
MSKKHKYDEYFKKFEEEGGRVHRATRPVGRPRPNLNNIPFE